MIYGRDQGRQYPGYSPGAQHQHSYWQQSTVQTPNFQYQYAQMGSENASAYQAQSTEPNGSIQNQPSYQTQPNQPIQQGVIYRDQHQDGTTYQHQHQDGSIHQNQHQDGSVYQDQQAPTDQYPPDWMLSSCGARFCFGGKLIIFTKSESDPPSEFAVRSLYLCQAITEPKVFEKASELHKALVGDGSNVNLPFVGELCVKRASEAVDQTELTIWQFLESHVRRRSRERYNEIIGGSTDVSVLSDKLKSLCDVSTTSTAGSDVFANGSGVSSTVSDRLQDDDDESPVWPSSEPADSLELPTDVESKEGLLCELVANGKYPDAVNICISEGRWADALQLSMQDRNLFVQTQCRYYEQLKDPVSKFISLVINDKWEALVGSASLNHADSWRRLFAILVNHADSKELAQRLGQLGKRIESVGKNKNATHAALCYIVAGLVDPLVENLSKMLGPTISIDDLHDIMEKAMILRVSLGDGNLRAVKCGQSFANRLGRYVYLLIGQGCLPLAIQLLDTLPEDTEKHLMDLRYRLYYYLSNSGTLPLNIRRPKPAYEPVRETGNLQRLQSMRRPTVGNIVPPPVQSYSTVGYQQSHSHAQPPAPPPAAVPYVSQHSQSGVSAIKTSRSRYPSYSSDGISYPTSSAGPPTSGSYGPGSGYANYPNPSPGIPQQHQWPPQASAQQQYTDEYSTQSAMFPTMGSVNTSAIPQPKLPPPPSGPAAQFHHQSWNDPPPLSPKKISATKKTELSPVTFPIFGGGYSQVPTDQIPTQYQHQTAVTSQYQHQAAVPTQQQSVPYSSAYQSQTGYQQQGAYQQQQSAQHSPAPAVPAPQIPAEHEQILSVLVKLGELTAARATSMQMKRRIEENVHKLNANLPAVLAYSKLSPSTIRELHQIIACIQSVDYNSALALYSNIVEGTDFSTIASFMPSVKAIIQCAAQIGVIYS